MGKHRSSFDGGLLRDRADGFAPPNTYYSALNAVHEGEKAAGAGLFNEQSNSFSVDVGGRILGTSYVEQIKKSILFVEKDGGSIYLFDHVNETLEFVMSDSEFGCDWGFTTCEFMYAEIKEHNACDDIYIYFSANCKYYVVNTTEMLDPVRKASVKSCEDCSYFELVHPICAPVINATPIQYAGSTLESGAVAFAVRLTDYDANYSNWFPISATTVLESENNFPGEPAISAVKVTFSGLDPRYEYLEVAVVKTGAGVTTVETLPKMAYSGGTYGFTYYGQKGFPIDIASITTQTKIYLRGKDLIQHDGRLFFYNIKREKNLNYQKYANLIEVSGAAYPVPLKQQVKYRFPSLQRGESYRFGIVWNYADGTHSKAFGIFGSGDKGGGKSGSEEILDYTSPKATYDTTDRLIFKQPARNENTENSAIEDAFKEDITNIDTNEADLISAAEQLDAETNEGCCDPTTGEPINPAGTSATDAIRADIGDVSNMIQNTFESLTEAAKDKKLEDFTLNKTASLKEAALELYNEVVLNKPYEERTPPSFTIANTDPPPTNYSKSSDGEFRGDNWVDIKERQTTDQPIGDSLLTPFSKDFSTLMFPDFKDCEGQRMFPQGNLYSYKVPESSQSPHYGVASSGVMNNLQPGNDPYSNITIWLMGAAFENIHIPTEEELPKPLCPTTPYSMVYVKRDEDNSTVIANGWTGGTELGENRGDQYNFIRHGVNSRDNVFRGVDVNGRRMTGGTSLPAYTFHSPDTDFSQGRLDATKVVQSLKLNGNGWRYGLYAKGKEPAESWAGNRIDQRGARVANSITGFTRNGAEYDIKGISYTKHKEVTQPVGGIEHPLENVYNESSVYFETDRIIPGNERDTSFLGDTLDHEAPSECNSAYVSLRRELPDQYGGIENSAYIQLGVRGGWRNGQVVTQTEGICGDIFIGPYTKRRTSFVSEKVGTTWPTQSRVEIAGGLNAISRGVCDQPDQLIYEILGLNINQTEFAETGDLSDPRNYAGLYTKDVRIGDSPILGVVGGRPLDHTAATEEDGPITDYYYPGTVTGVVYSIVEARVCAWHRTTGSAVEDRIFAEKLKEYELDSAASEVRPWEHCYLNNVNYVPVVQPSRKQLAKIAFIRNAIVILIPAASLASIANVSDVFEAVATMFASTGIAALFMMASQTLFTPENLRRVFGIDRCRTDAEEGGLYYKSERHKDNWNRYNWDFSKITTETQYLGINSLYNTCECDNCTTDDIDQRGGQTNKEIYYSAKQNHDTEIDAYRNIRIGMYNEMPVHAGNIRKMFLQNNNMYVHSTKGIWMVQMAAGNWPADIGSQLTGAGDLLMRPVMMLDTGGGEGFAGTNHPNNTLNIPGHGYFFVDDVARKIYRFNGNPQAISDVGMTKFFNQHLVFCRSEECHDEVKAPKYILGWDYKYNRLLFTKLDEDQNGSFTISYTPFGGENNAGKWISFHSYLPDFYMRDRYNMFTVKNNEIWKHNVPQKYQSFYGTKHPHFIQHTFVDEKSYKYFELENIKIFSNAQKGRYAMLNIKG
jgi:hypothetical protein